MYVFNTLGTLILTLDNRYSSLDQCYPAEGKSSSPSRWIVKKHIFNKQYSQPDSAPQRTVYQRRQAKRAPLYPRLSLTHFRKKLARQLFFGVRPLPFHKVIFLINDFIRTLVFFGCCIAGACKYFLPSSPMRSSSEIIIFDPVFTLLLPEVKGRDPDALLAAEIEAKRRAVVGIWSSSDDFFRHPTKRVIVKIVNVPWYVRKCTIIVL